MRRTATVGLIGNDVALLVPDSATTCKVERHMANRSDVLREQLRTRPKKPCGTKDNLILPLPRCTFWPDPEAAELGGEIHRTGSELVPVPGPEVEGRPHAGRELRNTGVERAWAPGHVSVVRATSPFSVVLPYTSCP